jgi:hypothetical protein
MARIHADRSKPGSSSPCGQPIGRTEKTLRTECEKRQRWPADAVTATYKYLSKGIRTLAQAYSTYDDRNIQWKDPFKERRTDQEAICAPILTVVLCPPPINKYFNSRYSSTP